MCKIGVWVVVCQLKFRGDGEGRFWTGALVDVYILQSDQRYPVILPIACDEETVRSLLPTVLFGEGDDICPGGRIA